MFKNNKPIACNHKEHFSNGDYLKKKLKSRQQETQGTWCHASPGIPRFLSSPPSPFQLSEYSYGCSLSYAQAS